MTDVGIFSWLNETSLQAYPFQKSFGLDGVFIDANFIQFDGFIPVLQTITVSDTNISLVILFDSGLKTINVAIADISTPVKIYDNTRYLGVLVFGDAAVVLLSPYVNQTITVKIPFLAHLVKSIPSKAGVYSIDGEFGAISFLHDTNIWFTLSGNTVTFNAVAIGSTSSELYLKTLNSVTPTNNAETIQESTIIHISSPANNTVEFSLVGGGDIVNNIIPTNPNPT